MVFASTQEDTDMLAEELAEAGLSVVALHGAMPQTVRNRRLRSIREGRAKILVATDVAARGLDVPTISRDQLWSSYEERRLCTPYRSYRSCGPYR